MDSEDAGQQFVLRLDHVADGDAREFHARLYAAIGGGRGDAVAEGVHRDHEVDRGIGEFFSDDEVLKFLAGAVTPRIKQDGVGFVRVERGVGAIADSAVAKRFSALQLDVAELGVLLLLRGGSGDECDGDEDPGDERARIHGGSIV